MNTKLFLATLALLSTTSCWSFQCYFTLAKDSCWLDYELTVDVNDSRTNARVTQVVIPKGKSWGRQQFECEPDQKFMYVAHFSPVFWQGDEEKTYNATRFWVLPNQINAGDSAWEVSVCYSADFAMVPLPPGATSNCSCDFSSIPPIPPKQVE